MKKQEQEDGEVGNLKRICSKELVRKFQKETEFKRSAQQQQQKNSYPARETNNFEEEEEARMHRRRNKAKLPEHKTTQHAPEKADPHTSTEGQDE